MMNTRVSAMFVALAFAAGLPTPARAAPPAEQPAEGAVTGVSEQPPPQISEEERERAIALFHRAMSAEVHIIQTRGVDPVELEWISPENPDEVDSICTKPCDALVPEGTYRISGPDIRPSKPFFLEMGRSYTLTVKPHVVPRMRGIGLGVGASFVVAGAALLFVPLFADMPMKHAYGYWGAGGALCAAGLGVGFGIAFSRTKVELTSMNMTFE